MSMFCSSCAVQLLQTDSFCSSCGTKVNNTSNEVVYRTETATPTQASNVPVANLRQMNDSSEFISDDTLLTSFVGKKAAYYLKKWRSSENPGEKSGFNWAAFFWTGYWLAFRKMYKYMAIFFIALIIEILVIEFIPWKPLSTGSSIAFAVAYGYLGNSLYYKFSKRKIDEFRSETNRSPLEYQGGTSWLGLFGAVGITIVILIVYGLMFG